MKLSDKLVSARFLWDGLNHLEQKVGEEAPFSMEFVTRREERLLLEFRRLIRAAEVEYLSTGAAAELTGWDAGTLRRYARKALVGDPLPEEWSHLVVRREGKEYALVLGTIPPKAGRAA